MIKDTDFSLKRVAEGLPIAPLLEAIAKEPSLWKENTWRQDEAGGQQDTESIMLRWADQNNFDRIRDSTSVVGLSNLGKLKESHEVFKKALTLVGAIEWGRSFIVKLKPGGRVYPHSDVGTYADKFERFHICLTADPEFEYHVQHPTGPIETCNMKPGELWFFNHKRVHWAHNAGKNDRISIVLDAVAPEWKRQRDLIAVGVGYKYNEH